MTQRNNIAEIVTDALYSVRTADEWDALFTATLDDDNTTEDGEGEGTEAYNAVMFGEASPVIVAALTAAGVTCDQDGNPGDGIAAAGSVASGHAREHVVIVDPDGSVRSPEEILEQISLAQADLDAQAAQAAQDARDAQFDLDDQDDCPLYYRPPAITPAGDLFFPPNPRSSSDFLVPFEGPTPAQGGNTNTLLKKP